MSTKSLPIIFSLKYGTNKNTKHYFLSPEKNFRNLRAKAAFGQYSRLSKHIKHRRVILQQWVIAIYRYQQASSGTKALLP